MRAGFETYRAFLQDKADLREHLAKPDSKMKFPVLATAGEASGFGPVGLCFPSPLRRAR
jgi:hypothetical protein